MHASVIEARQYRDRERARKNANDLKRQRNGIVRALGAEPALTPCLNPEGNHRTRRKASQPYRYEQRVLRIVKGMCAVSLVVPK